MPAVARAAASTLADLQSSDWKRQQYWQQGSSLGVKLDSGCSVGCSLMDEAGGVLGDPSVSVGGMSLGLTWAAHGPGAPAAGPQHQGGCSLIGTGTSLEGQTLSGGDTVWQRLCSS